MQSVLLAVLFFCSSQAIFATRWANQNYGTGEATVEIQSVPFGRQLTSLRVNAGAIRTSDKEDQAKDRHKKLDHDATASKTTISKKGLLEKMMKAIREDNPKAAKATLKIGLGVNTVYRNSSARFEKSTESFTLLHWAAYYNATQVTQVLLKRGASVDRYSDVGLTPLHVAAFLDRSSVAKILIDGGADIEARDVMQRTPLLWATHQNKILVAKLLIESGAEINCPDRSGWTVLHSAAAYEGNAPFVKYLIKHGADVNALTDNKMSPLHIAAYLGSLPIFKRLIKAGAEINVADEDGSTPLHDLCSAGHLDIVKVAVTAGGDVNAQDELGKTPLHYASGDGHPHVVKYLLKHRATVDVLSNDGRTALHLAAFSGRLAAAKLLVKAGASKKIVSKRGKKPRDEICENAYAKCSKETALALKELLS